MKRQEYQGHQITQVTPGSIAQELEIAVGDTLLAINNEEIEDVLDYGFLIKDEYIEVLIRKPDGEEWLLEIEKEYDDDLGIAFESGLMSDCRSCTNQCIFCFIDQMPQGMRETLYFKDDDARLSFLQGNYITLTNMREEDIRRIIRLRLSPINISVQTTNPGLRCRMLNNRFAGEKLQFLDLLYQGGIEMNGQIVLCKGVNDGAELARSIDDLARYLPLLGSLSVVPAGMTKYRKGLFPLEPFTEEESAAVIDLIESRQQGFYEQYGLHFVHASDEWYLSAGRPLPAEERYDGYVQLENGVGMVRLLLDELEAALEEARRTDALHGPEDTPGRTLTLATGVLAYPVIRALAGRIMESFPEYRLQVVCIRNDFFGETITVSGLITGQDLIRQLGERREDLGDTVLIPSNMLRTGEETFLDDLTIGDVERALSLRVKPVEPGGGALLRAILSREYQMDRDNGRLGYIRAYDAGERDKAP